MTAFRKFLNFFRPSPASSRSARSRSVRLEVECLDQRLLPSASSFNMHAVTDINGNATAFFRSPTNGALYQLSTGSYPKAIAASQTVTDFSAGLDANGHADLFAHHNGDMQLFDNGVWTDLGQPMAMGQFAAVDGGRAYFVGGDNSLWEYSPVVETPIYYRVFNGPVHTGYIISGGWQELWGANAVWSLDAVTERPNGVNSGRDVVVATGGDHRLEAFTQGGWFGNSSNKWFQITGGSTDGSPVVNAYSAGLDIYGNAEVYYIFTWGTLDRFDAGPETTGVGGLFGVLPSVDPYSTIRATPDGSFLLINDSGEIVDYVYHAATYSYVPYSGYPEEGGGPTDLAAADSNNFFYISGHLLQEWSNGHYYTFQI